MKTFVTILLLTALGFTASAQFKLTKSDLLAGAQYAISGVLWGAHEAYQADPYVFESNGFDGQFWAHDAWKNKYIGRNPENGMKANRWLGHTFRDVDHFTGTFNNAFAVSGTATVCLQDQGNWKHKALKVLAGVAVRSLFASATYRVLR
ncbi:MAG: hypothetical protein D6706_20055 [Chloroflexi bacterium]|nr:MAG: hypothetical protein D6706_20055 [Chloroflexota bacterium]